MKSLQKELQKAVVEENYESAAELRDQIRQNSRPKSEVNM